MFNDVEALVPLHFVELSFPALYKKEEKIDKKRYLLPDTSSWLGEDSFADIYFAWSEEELHIFADVKDSLHATADSKAQSIELFIDTRAQKNRKFVGIFSHHFVITPQAVEGFYAREISRFAKEAHPLCAPKDLDVEIEKKRKGYSISLSIPNFALHGYDPTQYTTLGITYQINRPEKEAQHFSALSEEVNIWQNSYLWATACLTK